MTGQNMIDAFSLRYGQEISADVPGLEDIEVISFLNQALIDVVGYYYQNSISNISDLVDTISLTLSASSDITNGYNLSTDIQDFLFYVSSRSKVTKTLPKVTNDWVTNEWLEVLTNNYIETAEHKPLFQGCKITKGINGTNMFLLIVDAYTTATNVELTYVRKPTNITIANKYNEVDINIGETQERVINRAVTFALDTMMNQRIQTQPIITK